MTLLDHYIRYRKIGNDIAKLKSCLVADRIRTAITNNNCLQYICSLESASKDGWLPYDKLAEALDTYWAMSLTDGKVKNPAAVTGSIYSATANILASFAVYYVKATVMRIIVSH